MLFIQDQTLAKTYQIVFEEMWGSSADQPNASTAIFGTEKSDNMPHHFIIGDIPDECYFSPFDNTNQKIINAINTANNDLNVETMLITRTDLANGILHNKLAIIEASNTESDPQVVSGSHNWSNSTNDINDENTLIIHNTGIANIYYQQFAYRFIENGGSLVVSAENFEMADKKVYPNLTMGEVKISASVKILKVQFIMLTGKMIEERRGINTNYVKIKMQNKIAGIYILKVELQNGNQNSYKIVKR